MSRLFPYADELAHLKIALDIAFGKGVESNAAAKEDRVVFPLGVATRNLFEEVIWSVNQGFGRAALRTSRTLYECVVFSLYINKHPETWAGYLNTLYAQWGKVLQNFSEAEQKLPAMHKVLSEKVPGYGEGKFISLSWSDDRTTFAMASDVGISELFHSLAFNYTSGFVHPSAMFLLSGFGPNTPDGRLNTTKESEDDESKMALQITHDVIINALRLRLKYADSRQLRESLAVCEKDFVKNLGLPTSANALASGVKK